MKLSGWWRIRLWFFGFWGHEILEIVTSVSKKLSVSIFRVKWQQVLTDVALVYK